MISDAFSVTPLLYVLIPVSFLLGSIPFGVLFTRRKGVDIRSIGSKNIGATNVLRAAGKKSAVLTLLGDLLKGLIPVLACRIIFINMAQSSRIIEDFWLGMVGLSAVLGHMFSIFLSFRGGKGVATGFGVLLIYSPAASGIMLIIWMTVALIFKYSALAALIAVTALPVILAMLKASAVKIAVGVVLAALIIYKHKSNIKNLMSGVEDKIGDKDDR
jgi:glycerol-3-phosphate acyltransferase PlsY